jgi:hypothetical protein
METIRREQLDTELVVRIDPTLRAEMEAYSEKAGESLDTFISKASSALIKSRKAEEWYRQPRQSTPEGRAWAIALLDRASGNPPMPGDELPAGYVPLKRGGPAE